MTRVFTPTDRKLRARSVFGGPADLWIQVRHQWNNLSWVLAGKFALIGANTIVMLFLANRLTLKTYGLLVISISGQLLISRFLMVGVDAGMVRLTAVSELVTRSRELVTAGLLVIVVTSSALILIGPLTVPILSLVEVPGWVLTCTIVGAIGTSLVDYGYSFRLARQEYHLAALAQGGTAVWRAGLTTLAVLKFPGDPVAVFAAYHGASLISGLAQTSLVAVAGRMPDRLLVRRLLNYSLWVANTNVIVIFSLYQGTLLLMLLKQVPATGLFGLGLTLSLGFFAIQSAYSEYLSERIRSLEHVSSVGGFIVRALAAALAIMLACVPIIFLVVLIVPSLLGPQWQEVVPIFVYLSASMVLLLAQAPFTATCHYLLRPQLITFGWITRVILIGIAGIILTPRMGAVGAAIAQLVGSALATLILAWMVIGSLRSAIATSQPVSAKAVLPDQNSL